MAEVETEELDTNAEAPPADGVVAPVEYLETEDEGELRSIISQISDKVEKLIPIPEWKVVGKDGKTRIVQVLVRALNTLERTQFINLLQKTDNDMTKVYPDLAIMTARHPKTERLLFKPGDRGMLQTRLGLAVERIALTATKISGLDKETLDSILKN